MTHILIVDDSELVLDWAKAALTGAGLQVVAHKSPFGILELVKQHQPSLILLDVNMPALNGGRLCVMLKKHMSNMRIVFYSGMSSKELAETSKNSGADGFIEKSQDPATFVRDVKRFL